MWQIKIRNDNCIKQVLFFSSTDLVTTRAAAALQCWLAVPGWTGKPMQRCSARSTPRSAGLYTNTRIIWTRVRSNLIVINIAIGIHINIWLFFTRKFVWLVLNRQSVEQAHALMHECFPKHSRMRTARSKTQKHKKVQREERVGKEVSRHKNKTLYGLIKAIYQPPGVATPRSSIMTSTVAKVTYL